MRNSTLQTEGQRSRHGLELVLDRLSPLGIGILEVAMMGPKFVLDKLSPFELGIVIPDPSERSIS